MLRGIQILSDIHALAEMSAVKDTVRRHSFGGYMPGSRDVLLWVDAELRRLQRRIDYSGIVWW